MQGQPAARSVTVEIIAAIVVALIFIFLFVDIPVTSKIVLILTLATVGSLNFVALVGWTTKARNKLWVWKSNRTIRRHPDLIADLYGFNRDIHKVLYERNAGYSSLAMKGVEAIQILSKELGDDDSAPDEFGEKLGMMDAIYTPTWNMINLYSSWGHRWTTLEFSEMLRIITVHLDALGKVFKTIYREAELFTERGNVVPLKAQNDWKDFVREFNPIISEWKKFTEKVGGRVGSGGVNASGLELAKEI